VPSPSQVRRLRIDRLIIFAKKLLEAGVPSHILVDRLEQASWRLWPVLSDKTRREYITAALKTTQKTLSDNVTGEVAEGALTGEGEEADR